MVCYRVLLVLLLLLGFTISYSPNLLSLRSKLEVDKSDSIPTTTTIPLLPYLHPALSLSLKRVKRGVDNFVHPRGDEAIIDAPILQPDAQVQQQTEEEKKECYFKHHRQTPHEKVERPTVSKIKESCGKDKTLRRMSELIDHQHTNQYGSPNALALILARGSGERIDWTDKNKVEEVGKRWICQKHETELGSNWESSHYWHYKRKTWKGGKETPECSMPHPFFQHSSPFPLDQEVYRIEELEAEAILKKKGVLVHPGLPICSAHDQLARKLSSQVVVEDNGHVIRPPPINQDFSDSPSISQDVNPFFDERDPHDPSYHTKHAKEELPEQKPPDQVLKKAYMNFMRALGVKPHIGDVPWHQLSDRYQRGKAEALKYVAHEIATLMSPDNPQVLMDKAFKSPSDYERPRPEKYEQMMLNVKEAFETSDTLDDRVAYISMVVHFTLSEIRRYIPGLSSHYYTHAKKYSRRGYARGPSITHNRVRYHLAKVERFIQFLTSYKVTLGLPYGTRRVKDSHKRWLEIPNTLRKLRSGEIYYLYKNELESRGEQILLLPESTVKKMIHICKAERRKSLHGVDITVAEAMEAFDNSDAMIDTMLNVYGIDKSVHGSLITTMRQNRQYIRTNYLIHAKEFSTIADHCWSYGLSDPDDPAFQTDCTTNDDYKHFRVCDRCEAKQMWYGDVRDELQKLAKKFKKDKKKSQEIAIMIKDWHASEESIDKLKAHQLRTAKAEDDRQSILTGINNEEAMVVLDLAMKHMPLQGRETTTDCYGQRGMPWHVSHTTVNISGEFHTHALIHIFDVNERQDSAAVTAVIRHVLQVLKEYGVKRVTFRSDQAGAYKSSSTLASIQSLADEVGGITVVGYYFSEALAGKGPCDRTSVIVKGVTRSYADAGGKVLNPEDFYHAVTTSRHREGISYHFVHLEGSGEDKKPKLSTTKIPEMSKLNAFTFGEKGLRLHRFKDIGHGKKYSFKRMQPNDAKLVVKGSGGTLSKETFWRKLGDRKYDENQLVETHDDTTCENKDSKKNRRPKLEDTLFRCPIATFSKEFLSEKNLEKHMIVGKHDSQPEKMNLQDITLNLFSFYLEKAVTPKVCPVIDEAMRSLTDGPTISEDGRLLPMGWALPKRRPSIKFPDTVKKFLKEIYEEGERTNAKTDAREAEKMMRKATDAKGDKLFQPNDLLTSSQIAGVYTGFKNTALDKRDRVPKRGSRSKRSADDSEPDEVNDLFDTEGDPKLEWETEPLFDEAEDYREAIKKAHAELFEGDVCDEDTTWRGWLPREKTPKFC